MKRKEIILLICGIIIGLLFVQKQWNYKNNCIASDNWNDTQIWSLGHVLRSEESIDLNGHIVTLTIPIIPEDGGPLIR